jgi:hypothetical protein
MINKNPLENSLKNSELIENSKKELTSLVNEIFKHYSDSQKLKSDYTKSFMFGFDPISPSKEDKEKKYSFEGECDINGCDLCNDEVYDESSNTNESMKDCEKCIDQDICDEENELDKRNERLRLESLSFASSFMSGKEISNVDEIINVAEKFYEYIKGF